jgi:radical SAM superfamily enzyme YgiQ (UPF0313 family)
MSFEIIRHNEKLRKSEKHLKHAGSGGKFNVCLVYPNTYYAGMSNLGFQSIFRQIADSPDFYCDRAFLPDSDMIPLYRTSKRKLVALESEKPLQEFDFIAFSISYEPDYFNILRILELAGIPLSSRDRGKGWPVILAGGEAVSINPEVISEFIDFFVIGEGEQPLAQLLDIIAAEDWQDREELLFKTAQVQGVYVPSFYKIEYDDRGFISNVNAEPGVSFPVQRSVACDLEEFTSSVILTPNTEFSDTFLVEISRGCPFSCAFCCVSLHHKPYRCAKLESLVNKISEGLEYTKKIGLLGAAVGSYPYLETILDEIKNRGGQVSFSSLRADVLKPGLLKKLNELGQNLLTLAPETGSDKLRRFINKTLTNEQIYRTAEDALKSGFKDIRLYFMLGLPNETDDDIDAGIEMIKKINEKTGKIGGRVFVSINQFVPKPGTALELCPLEEEETVIKKVKKVESVFFNNPAVNVKVESLKEMQVQAFLGRGNRSWSVYLKNLYHKAPSTAASKIMKMRKKDPSIESLLFKPVETDKLPPWKVVAET